jgi:hypothetical protein
MGTGDLPQSRDTNLKGGIRVEAVVTARTTIGKGEMVAEEGGEEGGEVVIMGTGTIERHTGIGIAMTKDRYLPDDTRDVDEADRGALHRGVPGTGMFHGGTTELGALSVWTRAHPRFQHSRPRRSHWDRKRMSLVEISDLVLPTPNQLQPSLRPRFQQNPRPYRLLR